MSAKNQHIYRKDQKDIERLAEEYRSIGRYVRVEDGHLIVLSLPPKKEVKKKVVNDKSKRREGYGRP